MRRTLDYLAVGNFTDIRIFGEYALVSTELFTALPMTNELSMYRLSGIEVKHTVKDIFLQLGRK